MQQEAPRASFFEPRRSVKSVGRFHGSGFQTSSFFYINNGTLTGKDTIGQIERNNNNITIVFEIISEINQ